MGTLSTIAPRINPTLPFTYPLNYFCNSGKLHASFESAEAIALQCVQQRHEAQNQMSAKEQLLNELEHVPDAMVEEILDFCLFLKQRQQHNVPEPSTSSEGRIASLLDLVAQIHAQVPPEEWDKLPHDGSINHDHYLYGAPKVEE